MHFRYIPATSTPIHANLEFFNSLPNNTILGMSKFEASTDNKGVAEIMEFIFDKEKNILGKGENAVYQKGRKHCWKRIYYS